MTALAVQTAVPPSIAGPIRTTRRFLAGHRLFACCVAVAVAVRVVTMVAYPPANIYYGDSYAYLDTAVHPHPMWGFQPSGYPLFLWLLRPLHSLVVVVAVQHAMGVGMGIMLYSLLRRRFRAPAWVATLAASPSLFDAYLIQSEHSILADTLFIFLVTAGVTAILWRPVPTMRLTVVAGACLSFAALARTVGLPLLAMMLLWLAVRRIGWRPIVVTAAVGGLLMTSYASWYHQVNGRFALSGGEGLTLWARTMTFADCKVIKPPADERPFCPNGSHYDAASEYVWAADAPLGKMGGWTANNDRARSFALHAIEAQPLDYLRDVAGDLSLAFHWNRAPHPARVLPAYEWGRGRWPLSDKPGAAATVRSYDSSVRRTGAVEPYAAFVRAYQKFVVLRGPLLAVLLLIGGIGLFFTRRHLFPYLVGVVLLVLPVAVLDFDHRYVLPALPLLSLSVVPPLLEVTHRRRERAQDKIDTVRVEAC